MLARVSYIADTSLQMQFKAPDAAEECFARKLIRTIIATKASIECEVQTITQILGTGGHENIVRILRHGMLPTSDYYFIDMELCSLNLRDYLGKYDRSIILRHFRVKQLHPVFIEKEETESAEITISQWQNIWTIMGHIASGLHFLHEHGFAHRDVKPANGTHPSPFTVMCLS
jgi:serine/threonine protein kinase